jgi:hypothetical protein
MAATAHPKQGDGINVVAEHARLRGLVAARRNGSLTVELDETAIRQPLHFAPGSELALEWIDPLGVMQVTARVGGAGNGLHNLLELELVGEPEPVERRGHDRGPVEVDVSAWTLAQATRRLVGTTVNVSSGGALLSLPDLAPHAATLQLQMALPDGVLRASAAIRWRGEPGLVGVEFERIDPAHRARLLEYLRTR